MNGWNVWAVWFPYTEQLAEQIREEDRYPVFPRALKWRREGSSLSVRF
jgi:hypothetical protein